MHKQRWRSAIAACGLLVGLPTAIEAGTCVPSGDREKVTVAMIVTTVGRVAGFKVRVDYPAAVSLPGARNERSVTERVKMLHENFLTSVNDQERYIQIVAASATTDLEEDGPVLSIEFDRCTGTSAPKASDFACKIVNASDPMGNDVRGATCSVMLGKAAGGDEEQRA